MNVLTGSFSDLSDPREDGNVIYPLTDILVIAVCAAISGAESYEDTHFYGKSKTSWLSDFLELKGGIPSHDTFRRVFGLIDAETFEACFTEWAKSQAESSPDGELVAIDGKTIQRSFDHGKEQSPLHVVSAWASEQSLALVQEVVDEKSNEITAIPEVLDALQLKSDSEADTSIKGRRNDRHEDPRKILRRRDHTRRHDGVILHHEFFTQVFLSCDRRCRRTRLQPVGRGRRGGAPRPICVLER